MPGKLTPAQRSMLQAAAKNWEICPGPKGSSTAGALLRRGLLSRPEVSFYRITEAGRALLNKEAESDG